MKVNVQYAEAHFAELASSAARGEDVEVSIPDGPTLKLVVSAPPPTQLKKSRKRILGSGIGKMSIPSWGEWKAADKEIEREMCDAPLISTGEI